MYDWKWYLKDIVQDKDVKVFTTFSCGGGSSMGYKRVGFKVLGNVEIDKTINDMYVKNHHPKYNYFMDLRDFNKLEDLPEELYHLDILDGSPPCSTFSTAGSREEAWGKEKVFREGQKKQTLDDLFFVFLKTVEKLRPKVVVAENVTGLVKGNAKGYVNEIAKQFRSLGYEVQLFRLNAAKMEVPQYRERVFFIANRCGFPKIKLDYHYKEIPFGEVRSEHGKEITTPFVLKLLPYAKESDGGLADVNMRVNGKNSYFNNVFVQDYVVCPTILAHSGSDVIIRMCDKTYMTDQDYINCSSFPQDYDFMNNSPQYVVGMSVPPNMMAHIAMDIWEQWLKK